MEVSLYKVKFVTRDSNEHVVETVRQKQSNALSAAVAKYYRSKRSRDFSARELNNQIKYQIAWLKKNRGAWRIIPL